MDSRWRARREREARGVEMTRDGVLYLHKKELFFPDGCTSELDVLLVAKYEVCDLCDGSGKHVNPNIDDNGLTGRDIDELGGAKFLSDYMRGRYDVKCYQCGGQRVVAVLNREVNKAEYVEAYDYGLRVTYEMYAEEMSERSMGA